MNAFTPMERATRRLAGLVDPRHEDLVRGMLAESAAIPDEAERRRFRVGVLFTVLRLAVSAQATALLVDIGVFAPEVSGVARGGVNPTLAPRELLRRHVSPFVASLGVLTALQLTNYATRAVPQLGGGVAGPGAMARLLMLSVPFILAMTLPMGVYLAVAWVFTRLGDTEPGADATRGRGRLRRLLAPVLSAAAALSLLALISNTQVLPYANHQLRLAMSPRPSTAPTAQFKSDREMTVGELRAAARDARASVHPSARAMAPAYEVEIHKKYALAAACMVLALAAAAFGVRFPGAGPVRVAASSLVVFVGYYVCLVAGEQLVDARRLPPAMGMWFANVVLLLVAATVLRPSRSPSA
ncbi:MAG: LptF/LptG family permease [Gemmatimonadaceae bacterium]|nr:LptF/LptG family permease [Gemmatimonadaceae bacterium]